MHASSEGPTDDNAGAVAVVQPLELCAALLAVRTDFADPNLVAHNLNWLGAFGDSPEKNKVSNIVIIFVVLFLKNPNFWGLGYSWVNTQDCTGP